MDNGVCNYHWCTVQTWRLKMRLFFIISKSGSPACSRIGWQYLQLNVQLCPAEDGRRNRPKHVELFGNKLWKILTSCWLQLKNHNNDARTHEYRVSKIEVLSCKYSQLWCTIFSLCLFILSKCFGRLCVHHREKEPCVCNTWYLLFWNKWLIWNYKGVCHKIKSVTYKQLVKSQ